jgi:chorismate mutase
MNDARLRCRGIRGATTAAENTADSILGATGELLTRLISVNQIVAEDTAAIFFTATPDLDATFPARAARDLGYVNVPLMCSQEIPVSFAPVRCIRVLMLVNTFKRVEEIVHVYLRGAASLRSDLNDARGP